MTPVSHGGRGKVTPVSQGGRGKVTPVSHGVERLNWASCFSSTLFFSACLFGTIFRPDITIMVDWA